MSWDIKSMQLIEIGYIKNSEVSLYCLPGTPGFFQLHCDNNESSFAEHRSPYRLQGHAVHPLKLQIQEPAILFGATPVKARKLCNLIWEVAITSTQKSQSPTFSLAAENGESKGLNGTRKK
ncbi:hypothetical protein Anapl_08622 [Anas platyrhynchos]|uniref:Uncharacterized protein n=1 Tax=Anas platyrhynchos TaxID=8839 RepID=R0KD90_ANAPL|nr:hypothetical protein Anapl_08622 [Anas platyrhynchos]